MRPFLPWTLLRSILRETLVSFLLALGGLTAVFVVILLMQALNRFEVISTSTLLSMVPSMASGYQTLLLPIAALTAVSLAYARLSSSGEKTALFSSGVSPRKVLLPAFALGVVLLLPSTYAAFKVSPDSYRERDKLRAEALSDALRNPPAGAQDFDFSGFSIAYSDYRDGTFHDLVMRREDAEGKDVILCKEVRIDYDNLTDQVTLIDGNPTTFLRFDTNGDLGRVAAEQHIIEVSQALNSRKTSESGIKAMGPRSLLRGMAPEAKSDFAGKRHHTHMFARHLAEALAPFFFALIGALVSMVITTKNRLIPLFSGLILAAGTYFGGLSLARPIAQSTTLTVPLSLAFTQVVIFGPMLVLAAGLWVRARRG